ncbi:hypothetical protein D0809_13475 [Flavobacterium circumlabens]|uniref:Uncharacterized protein n=1 Tax=Flavobacterium circumlabens TaxID=2133765 RepID=A0A4Y7UBR3_9FLAO|nr:hypothetical protein [Flavobacterium circumlabens]TEB43897.1 hypothetical protein D0809_13475 [Flavobacterium circumlabens]
MYKPDPIARISGYPGGRVGLPIDQESLYLANRAINPNYQAFPSANEILKDYEIYKEKLLLFFL